jgi:hypothetical protein
MAFNYAGFKLAEKKAFKDYEHYFAPAEKQIKDKLGADWQLVIDFPAFEKATNETTGTNATAKGDRDRLPQCIFERYVQPLGEEIAQMDAETAEAVNDAITEKKVVISLNPEDVDARYTVKIGTAINVLVQQDRLSGSYPYDRNTTVTAILEKTL